jgi:hypothetical protein
MPIWFTIAIGVAGSIAAGIVGQIVFDEPSGGYLIALLAAIAIVIAYRRWTKRRGITGPDAEAAVRHPFGVRQELEEKLRDLRDAGLLSEEEFEVKRAQLRSRA